MDKEETLVGKRVKRFSDGKVVTIKSERMIDYIPIYTDTEGNIYPEHELDIRWNITPWYFLFEALRDNGLMRTEVWSKHSNLFESAFNDFMASMQKAGYIARKEEEE